MYRGLLPTLCRDVPFSAIYWALYEHLKNNQNLSLFGNASPIVGGAICGSIAAAITTPFDVAKTRLQVNQSINSSQSMIMQLNAVWKDEGLSGLTRGIIPRVFKVAPACAIMIASYEWGKRFFSSNASLV